jgi:hypothetical protein
MTRLIDPGTGDAMTLDALVEALETASFDPHDEDSFAALGPLLARLGRKPDLPGRPCHCRAQDTLRRTGRRQQLWRAGVPAAPAQRPLRPARQFLAVRRRRHRPGQRYRAVRLWHGTRP